MYHLVGAFIATINQYVGLSRTYLLFLWGIYRVVRPVVRPKM
jgi:hypothetical protein